MRLIPLALVLALLVAAPIRASDVELSGAEGHPRDRFPLAVHITPSGEASLDAAAKRALGDWNAVSDGTLGLLVFRDAATATAADVIVTFHGEAARLMGVTRVATTGRVIDRPVRITIFPMEARGQTSRETLVYQVVAHELGHALGLAHTRDPQSLMCCVHGSLDFDDPVARQTYVSARRNPDVRTAALQLAEHYARFWKPAP